jgi:hypothetical protein
MPDARLNVVSGGIASGKTRAQVERLCQKYPEWSELLALIAPASRYEVIAISDYSMSVQFADPHWRLGVHLRVAGHWIAEVHDLDERVKNPDVYIGPIAHAEDPDRLTAIRNALINARVYALDEVDAGILGHARKECDSPICHREVGTGVMYCCKACGDAHEGGYKLGPPGFWPGILTHSPLCDKRAYEGDWSKLGE